MAKARVIDGRTVENQSGEQMVVVTKKGGLEQVGPHVRREIQDGVLPGHVFVVDQIREARSGWGNSGISRPEPGEGFGNHDRPADPERAEQEWVWRPKQS